MSGELLTGLLVYTPEQEEFRAMARQVAEKEAPISRFRAMRDAGRTSDPELWATLTALGWPALPFAEADGGLGLGPVEVALAMEALGRTLATTPMLSAVLAGALDPGAGIQGGRVVALAWQEDARRPDPAHVATHLRGGRIHGAKVGVLDAGAAEAFVVSARDGEGIALFRVEAADASVQPLRRLDHRDAGNVRFEGARTERLPGGLPELGGAVDAGTIALSAELLGGAAAALDRTLAWLAEREQFDVPLGSFQVLQHRAVDMFVAVELARSAVMAAAFALGSGQPAAALASLAKARVSDAFGLVARESVQMHGGIGMTDECDVGFFLKRSSVGAETLGSAAWHRARWATLHGY